jgi:hypothetical protein
LAFSKPVSPTRAISSATYSLSTGRPATSKGNAMFFTTLRHGSSAWSWKAMPSSLSLRSSAGVRPSTRAWPLVGSSSPASTRRIVDLPQPEGPSSARNDPCSVCRCASSSAVTLLPAPTLKVLPSPST